MNIRKLLLAFVALTGLLTETEALAAPAYYQPTADIATLKAYGASSPAIAKAVVPSMGMYGWQATCPGTTDDKVYVAATGVSTACWSLEAPKGTYTGQLIQPATGPITNTNGNCLNIFTFLSPSDQAAIQAGSWTPGAAPTDLAAVYTKAQDALLVNPLGGGAATGGNCIFSPPGKYAFNGPMTIKRNVTFQGAGGGGVGAFGYATLWVWPIDTAGVLVPYGGSFTQDGWSIRDTALLSIGGTDHTKDGILSNKRGSVIDVAVMGFPGDLVHFKAAAPSAGNANGWYVSRLNLIGLNPFTSSSTPLNVNALHLEGPDTNAGLSEIIDCSYINGACIMDESGLGNAHIASEASNTGKKAQVTYSGHNYQAWGTATTAQLSANQPDISPTYWRDLGAGSGFTTWTTSQPSHTFEPGSTYVVTGASSASILQNMYVESSDPPGYLGQHTIAIGGLVSTGWTGIGLAVYAGQGVASSSIPFGYNNVDSAGTGTITGQLGGSALGTVFQVGGTSFFGSGAEYKIQQSGNDIIERFGGLADRIFGWKTGISTTTTFGGSTAVPYAGGYTNLLVGDGSTGGINTANWRVLRTCSASPSTTTMARGNICFNRSISSKGVAAWLLATSGSPDTYIADYINERNSPTAGIGYVVGAGGAVTQATSRTTGVTLNTVSGAITLVSAAGSAAPFTFTVTDSSVGLTDTVSVSLKSGTTDKYLCGTTVAAGSFDLTCQTTGGTTTETPTLNFNVIKGAAS